MKYKKVEIRIRDVEDEDSEHNLLCWICNERDAEYFTDPVNAFFPCWRCRENR